MDERDWTDAPLVSDETLDLGDCQVALEPTDHIALVSGDLEAARAQLCPGAPMLGLGGESTKAPYVIRIARDHAVFVLSAAPPRADGWQAEGFALTRADDRFKCLRLAGPRASEVISYGIMAALPEGSPSAAIRFCGATALLTRTDGALRLWVESGHLTAVTTFLRALGQES